jgi:meiotic recombination protein SPO11
VDRYVDDIAFTFSVSRSKLNVTAAAKGLVAGAFRLSRRDGSILDAAGDRDGILVPPLRDILSVDLTAVKWILVIEKEATFRSIASSSFWDIISTRGIILTGKGYPDIATRALLHFLSTASPQNGFTSPPVLAWQTATQTASPSYQYTGTAPRRSATRTTVSASRSYNGSDSGSST